MDVLPRLLATWLVLSLFVPTAPAISAPTPAVETAVWPIAPPDADPTAPRATPQTIVHLFEWRWTDVAQECTTYLGPKGIDAVQISPPSENAVVAGRPWYERYQPVSYQLITRSGDETAFQNMVDTCNEAGVTILVDAVINHMTGVYAGVGTAGTEFSPYTYGELWTYEDFHHCGLTPNDDIWDYRDRTQVQYCELVNLADLRIEAEHVQARIAAYLQGLLDLGVGGFRIDAAKHMNPVHLQQILQRLEGEYYLFSEVIEGAGEPIHGWEYLTMGAVTEFDYAHTVGHAFIDGNIQALHRHLAAPRFLPSDDAIVFVENHDLERSGEVGHSILTYRQESLHRLAQLFSLLYPYGTPKIMSGYAFEDRVAGPPDGDIYVEDTPAGCSSGTWTCAHRDPWVAKAVTARKQAADRPVVHWAGDTDKVVSFGRGEQAHVLINASDEPWRASVPTALADGSYCNELAADVAEDACEAVVQVSQGWLSAIVESTDAVLLRALTPTTSSP